MTNIIAIGLIRQYRTNTLSNMVDHVLPQLFRKHISVAKLNHSGSAMWTVPGTFQMGQLSDELAHFCPIENVSDLCSSSAGLHSTHVCESTDTTQLSLLFNYVHEEVHS